MENANSYEYLEKIKIAVIENLKRTAAVPSVQMQDVPRQGLGMSDEQDDELDDLDADENPDVRMTQRQWEKSTVRPEDALYESDDDELAAANGVYKTAKTRRSILDHPNPNADVDMDSGVVTPARNGNGAPADSIEAADDTMVDDTVAEVQDQAKVDTSPKANGDGDVDMVDASEPAVEAPVKTEEVDAQATLPADEGNKATATEAPAPAVDASKDAAPPAEDLGNGQVAVKESAAADGDRMETDDAAAKEAKADSSDTKAAKSVSMA